MTQPPDRREPSRPAPAARGAGLAVVDFDYDEVVGASPAPRKPAAKPPQPELCRAIYISHTRTRMPDAELDVMMTDLFRRNTLLGLSGLFLYKSRTIFEVLEGPPDRLEFGLQKTFCDPRHFKMKLMHMQPAKKRRFDGWYMGFRRLDGRKTAQPCYFSLTRKELEARFPRGATKEIMHFLRSYLEARFPHPEEQVSVECRHSPSLYRPPGR